MFQLAIKIGFRNVRLYWRQSLAALVSLLMSFFAMSLFSGYILNIFEFYKNYDSEVEMKGHIIVETRGASDVLGRSDVWAYSLSKENQNLLTTYLDSKKEQVEVAARFLRLSGSLDTKDGADIFRGIAYDPENAALIRGKKWAWNTYFGKPMIGIPDNSENMVIGMRLAQRLDCLPNPLPPLDNYFLELESEKKERPLLCSGQTFQLLAMTEHYQVNALHMKVLGAYDTGYREFDERFVSMPLKTAQLLLDTDKISYFVIKLKNESDIPLFVSEINQFLAGKAPTVVAQRWQDHPMGEFYVSSVGILTLFRLFMMTIVIFVSCMSVFNTFIKLVKERTKEVGMLRSLGFLPRFIRSIYMLEAFFLTVLGCSLGAVLVAGTSWLINSSKITYNIGLFSFKMPLRIDLLVSTYFNGFLLLMFLAVVASYIAVRGPSKDRISELLIHK